MKTKKTIPEYTIGIDLGDAKHAICVPDAEGEVVGQRPMSDSREALKRLARSYPGARVALEVGSHSPWTSRFLEEHGMEALPP